VTRGHLEERGVVVRTLVRPEALATVRTGIGVVMLLAPQVLLRVLEVDGPARARTSWVVQMVGVREVALGAGVLTAEGTGPTRPWALAGSACDVVDALVIGAAVRRDVVSRPWGGAIALSALAAGAVSGVLAGRR
jgi:peptide-methionine (R)-S-oxide reductase